MPLELVKNGVARLCEVFQKEFSGVVDRLVTAASAEIDAATERARTESHTALNAALADLEERSRKSDALTESVLQLEIQVEELRLKLQRESDRAKATTHECEQERNARARAEAVSEEAHAVRERLVTEYESRLQAAQSALEAERERTASLKQQLEAQVSEKARLLTALKTVQQAVGLAESTGQGSEVGGMQSESPVDCETQPDAVQNQSAATTRRSTGSATHPSGAGSNAGRKLQLVTASEPTVVDVPPALVEYVKQVFDQIDATYWVDHQVRTSVEVVERLTANLRYAHDAFERQVKSTGGIGATLFDQELDTRLDANGATSLGRHLAIAAYELRQNQGARAVAL